MLAAVSVPPTSCSDLCRTRPAPSPTPLSLLSPPPGRHAPGRSSCLLSVRPVYYDGHWPLARAEPWRQCPGQTPRAGGRWTRELRSAMVLGFVACRLCTGGRMVLPDLGSRGREFDCRGYFAPRPTQPSIPSNQFSGIDCHNSWGSGSVSSSHRTVPVASQN